MGTSQSKRDPRPESPLVPPWAAPAGPPPGPEPSPDPDEEDDEPQRADPPRQEELALPRRYASYRTSLREFVRSGDRNVATKALGHWARTSNGGASASVRRHGLPLAAGASALAALARAFEGAGPERGALDIRSFSGLPADEVANRIVAAFCPPGVLDQELARLAIEQALAGALEGLDTFDLQALDANAVKVAVRAFLAELVFLSAAGDAGRAFNAGDALVAVKREREIRQLVREVVDVEATPVLGDASVPITTESMRTLLDRLLGVVLKEIEGWT